MTTETKATPAPALDHFERYYTEKIWEWIPAVYKDEDGLAAEPDVLRSLVKILARQAAVSRRSIDRLWEDQFIEVCDDWAIPYIGDLVGTRLVHELNRRGRRVDVARTIFYRRRKGTPLVLEILIRDITGWAGVVVESFRRLARTRHGLDPEPEEVTGSVTQTPPGGWARLQQTRGAELVDGPFDELAHTPDFRQLRGKLGRYNIPKLNLHLFRLLPFKVGFATAVDLGDGRFTFDPSGRDIPLFRPNQRPDPQTWRPPRPWELPGPIPCRLLGAARYTITADTIDALVTAGLSQAAAAELSRYAGVLFRGESRLRQTLATLPQAAQLLAEISTLLAESLTDDSAKLHLIPNAVAVATGADIHTEPVERQLISAGNLADWGDSLGMLPAEKRIVIDPERGRFWFPTPPSGSVWVPVYHYGFSGNIGAGIYERADSIDTTDVTSIANGGDGDPGPVTVNVPLPSPSLVGAFQFEDNKTYLPDGDITGIENVVLQAANFTRPYVKRIVAGASEWLFQSDADASERCLTIDGLWIGIEQEGAAPIPTPCPPVPTALVLDGDFDAVVIRHCTLDPGGEMSRVNPAQCQAIPYVQLVIRGIVQELVIESSILGPIVVDTATTDLNVIQKIDIRDSIVHSIDAAGTPAIATRLGHLHLRRATVFGNVNVNRLYASEALIQGRIQVTDTQHGCFRFSATNDDPGQQLPPRFESFLFAPRIPNHFFASRRFGDPGYAQLSDTAPPEIVRGAENRSEIGVFSSLFNPIKLDDLKAKVTEFMPFGLIPQFINET